tara:strand:+ start:188 stop:640 length:453 start_codon:yes stop_codon:yes gene_type:complete
MNLVINYDKIDPNYIFFQEAVRNTVMDNSNFIRVLYSNELLTLNGIFIEFSLRNVYFEQYFAKYKCTFNSNENNDVVSKVSSIEQQILNKCPIYNKSPQLRIGEQLRTGSIKLFTNISDTTSYHKFILKISGIWETSSEYGITFKFIDIT